MTTRRMICHLAMLTMGGLLLAACTRAQALPQEAPVGPATMANPAAEYCEEQGGQHVITTAPDGNQSGVCRFPDGGECEAWAYFRGECQPGESAPVEDYASSDTGSVEAGSSTAPLAVTAWVGRIRSLPAGSPYDDYVIFMPEGAGQAGLQGATPEIEAAIVTLRDADGVRESVHLWGSLQCEVDDHAGCRLLVSDLQYGVFQREEVVEGWSGTVTCTHFNSGPSPVCGNGFTLAGPFAVQFGLWSPDPEILVQIENLRDSRRPVRIWGRLLSGVPDVNGTQLQVTRLEVEAQE